MLQIFDVNRRLFQRLQSWRLDAEKRADCIHREIAFRIFDRLQDIKDNVFQKTLLLGAPSLYVSQLVPPNQLGSVHFSDHKEVFPFVSSANSIPIDSIQPGQDFDAAISNLFIHNVNDLEGLARSIEAALKPNGVLLASVFGSDTLCELRTCMQSAELERTGGVSRRFHPMLAVTDFGNLLSRCRFSLVTVDHEHLTVQYPSVFELLEDLFWMGESNSMAGGVRFLPRDILAAAGAAYQSLFGNPDGSINATFHIIYGIGWKHSDTQPKPKERGSATHSFRDSLA